MSSPSTFHDRLSIVVNAYLGKAQERGEHLSLLRWQLDEGHRLDDRATMPGHLKTSAIVLSPNGSEVLLVRHRALGRWLQPGGHYEHADTFMASARREAMEETGLVDMRPHPLQGPEDVPFRINSHDIPADRVRGIPAHVHHDLRYLFVADPSARLTAQLEEVAEARWHPVSSADFLRLDTSVLLADPATILDGVPAANEFGGCLR